MEEIKGWIKMERKIRNIIREITPVEVKIFFYLAISANFSNGQTEVSYRKISDDTAISPQKTRTAIKKLAEKGIIHIQSYPRKKTVFKINKYIIFQHIKNQKKHFEISKLQENGIKSNPDNLKITQSLPKKLTQQNHKSQNNIITKNRCNNNMIENNNHKKQHRTVIGTNVVDNTDSNSFLKKVMVEEGYLENKKEKRNGNDEPFIEPEKEIFSSGSAKVQSKVKQSTDEKKENLEDEIEAAYATMAILNL